MFIYNENNLKVCSHERIGFLQIACLFKYLSLRLLLCLTSILHKYLSLPLFYPMARILIIERNDCYLRKSQN